MKKNSNNILSITDLSSEDLKGILKLAHMFKKKPLAKKNALKYKTLALLFQKPSNRTRISFEVAMTHLGGYTLYLSPAEISMGVREPVKDVACVLSRYVDGIAARVFSHQDILTIARYSEKPVINALSDLAHPCQALGDILTISERFRSFRKTQITYIGDGNNVLNSLLMASAKVGLNINIATPKGYEPAGEIVERAKKEAKKNKSFVNVMNDPKEAIKKADIVYTDVWTSMGQEAEKEQRLKDFKGYQVNETLLSNTGKETLIMHCLPAHRGEEISDIVDSKNSIIYDQAENRMHVEKALLYLLMG
ncbi:MAG: ornithine carbamoyltransferase [Candidatus Omnitrophica bacterium]|nr:ornithine carbamoyltransferase [Candidatus Omnitrophota bacterium]